MNRCEVNQWFAMVMRFKVRRNRGIYEAKQTTIEQGRLQLSVALWREPMGRSVRATQKQECIKKKLCE